MSKENEFRRKVEQYATPRNVVLAIVGTAVLLFVIIGLVRRYASYTQAPISEDQIMLERDGEIIIVNKNGLIEHRKDDIVTYKLWSADRVSKFFDAIERKAREYLAATVKQTTGCVFVTLYLDGQLVTVCINEDDEIIKSTFEEFQQPGSGDLISISDLFGNNNDNGQTNDSTSDDISDYFAEPTPTPVQSGATPTPTPQPSGDGGQVPLPVKADCLDWEENIVGTRAIISNTLCSIQPTNGN